MGNSKEYAKKYNLEYYKKNRDARKLQIISRVKRIQDEVKNYKLSSGCSVCGYNKCVGALHFHHQNNDKENTVGRMVSQGRAMKSIKKEIEKCVLLCSNCHAEEHEKLTDANSKSRETSLSS